MRVVGFILGLLLSFSAFCAETQGPFLWRIEGRVAALTVAPGHTVYADSVRFLPDTVRTIASPAVQNGLFVSGTHRWQLDVPPLAVEYQGCREGMCFPPARHDFSASVAQAETFDDGGKFTVVRQACGMMSKAEFLAFLRGEKSAASHAENGFWTLALLALLGGIALNFTPCVLPLAPVNLAIIGADGGGMPGFRCGLAYGAGMAVAYGSLGLISALAGTTFGALNGKWWFNLIVALLFFLLAAASAGWIDLNFFSRWSVDPAKLKAGRFPAAFLLGSFAALLAGACVAPVAAGVLLFTVERYQRGEFYALALPFLLGIGMALPWPFAGAGLGVFPKPGKWMLLVKYFLALLVALLGIYYAYLGISLLGSREPAFAADPFAALTAAADRSRRDHRPILVDFTASWCKNCLAMKRTTLADPEVRDELQRSFHTVVFAAEDPAQPRIAALLAAWRVPGFPAFVVVDPAGR